MEHKSLDVHWTSFFEVERDLELLDCLVQGTHANVDILASQRLHVD